MPAAAGTSLVVIAIDSAAALAASPVTAAWPWIGHSSARSPPPRSPGR
jgi:hypothetical protein